MPKLVRNDDPLNAVGQITVDYNQFAPRRNQEKALAGTGTLSHWTIHHLDIQILADLIRVICLIFHLQSTYFLPNRHRQQSTRLTSESSFLLYSLTVPQGLSKNPYTQIIPVYFL